MNINIDNTARDIFYGMMEKHGENVKAILRDIRKLNERSVKEGKEVETVEVLRQMLVQYNFKLGNHKDKINGVDTLLKAKKRGA
jgi:hypothetical protein